jgi:predicted molibdopterin-dependent oxidoreductase YjgC
MGAGGWQRPAPQPSTRRAFLRVEDGLPARNSDYPLVLATGRLLYDRGTLLRPSERLQRLVPDAYVMLHPAAAAEAGVADGDDDVSIVSAQGRVNLSLRICDEVAPGVAFVPENLADTPLSVLSADQGMLTWVRIEK